jgi:hypothetical protein
MELSIESLIAVLLENWCLKPPSEADVLPDPKRDFSKTTIFLWENSEARLYATLAPIIPPPMITMGFSTFNRFSLLWISTRTLYYLPLSKKNTQREKNVDSL